MASERKAQSETWRLANRARGWLAPHARPFAPVSLEEPEMRNVYRILNFALRAGGLMLASGAGTTEVESTILDLVRSCGLQHCEVDVTFTSMTASYVQGDDVAPVTAVQVVRQRSVDYGRLAAIHRLRSELASGRIDLEQAFARLEEVLERHSRRHLLVLLGWAGMAAAFTVLLGGKALVASVAFLSTAVVYAVNRRLARAGLPDFFLSAVGAAIATAFALALVALHLHVANDLVVAGGIMVLVPGYALVASTQDVMTGFPISGGARGLEVVLTATGIVTGVALALYASVSLGLPAHLASVALAPSVDAPLQVFAAGVAAALYGTATAVPRRDLLAAGAVGALGWGSYLGLRHLGTTLIFATALAAIVVGVSGNLIATRRDTHPFLFVAPGLMPLVPGLTIYQGMLDLFESSGHGGLSTLLRAAGTGLAIAAGVILGNMAVGPLRRPARSRS
jgi:uncharacterized membrane protein YjjP (DUF1212 family)